jgi:hypothetical protein
MGVRDRASGRLACCRWQGGGLPVGRGRRRRRPEVENGRGARPAEQASSRAPARLSSCRPRPSTPRTTRPLSARTTALPFVRRERASGKLLPRRIVSSESRHVRSLWRPAPRGRPVRPAWRWCRRLRRPSSARSTARRPLWPRRRRRWLRRTSASRSRCPSVAVPAPSAALRRPSSLRPRRRARLRSATSWRPVSALRWRRVPARRPWWQRWRLPWRRRRWSWSRRRHARRLRRARQRCFPFSRALLVRAQVDSLVPSFCF